MLKTRATPERDQRHRTGGRVAAVLTARAIAHAAGLFGRDLDVLEAGCGQGGGLALGGTPRRVVGIDIDTPRRRSRALARADLAAHHLGDLRSVPLAPRAFDVVYSAFLLEHVPYAELVLDRFVTALRPGGLLLLRICDRDCAYGRLDRALPDPLRRWMWRRTRPGHDAPGPAVYERLLSTRGIRAYCEQRGLVVAERLTARAEDCPAGFAVTVLDAGRRLAALLSHGRITDAHDEVAFVIRKPEDRFARVL